MSIADILAIPPGLALDEAIHKYAFGLTGRAPAYSTSDADGITLLDKLPLYVARIDPPRDASRPWIAGTMSHDPTRQIEYTTLRVAAATRMAALCKATLLVVFKPAPAVRVAPAAPAPQPTAARRKRGRPAKVTAATATNSEETPTPGPQNPVVFGIRKTRLDPMPVRRPIIPEPETTAATIAGRAPKA